MILARCVQRRRTQARLLVRVFDRLRRESRDRATDRPELTSEQLAAITDAEEVADIRAATDAVLAAFDGWRKSPGWKRDDPGCRRFNTLVDRVRLVLDDLPADPDLSAVAGAVGPLLNVWWPSGREPALEALSEAIERLRYLTAWRPSFIQQARMSTGLEPRDGPGPMRDWRRSP